MELTRRRYGKTTFTWISVRIGNKWQSTGDPLQKILPSGKDFDEAIERAKNFRINESTINRKIEEEQK